MHRMHECRIEATLCKRVGRMGEMLATAVKAGVATFRCAARLAADQHDKHCEAAFYYSASTPRLRCSGERHILSSFYERKSNVVIVSQ